MDSRNAGWASAFHRQAHADFAAFQLLADSTLPRCQALHFLQMATEKLAKAYRLADEPGATPESVRGHTGLQAFVQTFCRSPHVADRLRLPRYAVALERARLATTAAKIERLAPATDPMGQPRNTEYPWEVGGHVVAPIDVRFEDLNLQSREMLRFFKLIATALVQFKLPG